MTSSAGGGSCYYGGMISHTTTHSVALSVVNPRSLSVGGAVGSGGSAGVGLGLRPARQNSLYLQSNLSAYVGGDPETPCPQHELTMEKNRHVRASKGSPHSKIPVTSLVESLSEAPYYVLPVKELETVL